MRNMVINKAKETMTAKESVLKTFNLEKTDRVTIGYEANQGAEAEIGSGNYRFSYNYVK